MTDWNEKDLAWCPDLSLEGQILRIEDDRALIWWEDDEIAWAAPARLEPLHTEGAP